MPPCTQSGCSPSAILLYWHADCSHCPTTIYSSRRVKRQIRRSHQDPSEIRREDVFWCRPRSWNRLPTELKLMRSMQVFKRSLKTFLFQTAYSGDRTIKLDCVMRHRSTCRRRTKSTVLIMIMIVSRTAKAQIKTMCKSSPVYPSNVKARG